MKYILVSQCSETRHHVVWLTGTIVSDKDGHSRFLWNAFTHVSQYMVSHPRRL